MRRMTYSPQYGLGRGRRTVACMSLVSSAGERVERVSPADSLRDNMRASFQGGPVHLRTGLYANGERRLGDLVEEFVDRRTDPLQPSRVLDAEIGVADIPGVGRDLVLDDEVLHGGVTDARPAFTVGEHHVEVVGNDRGEIVDIRVPITVVCRDKQELRIVVEEHV